MSVNPVEERYGKGPGFREQLRIGISWMDAQIVDRGVGKTLVFSIHLDARASHSGLISLLLRLSVGSTFTK